jgi:DNA 3'-phosphatase
MKDYKVLFADLDGTLIETISGETFPKGIWDMRLRFDVLDKIKDLKPEYICIVSNQGGIELEMVFEMHFIDKMRYIESSIREYTGIPVYSEYCATNSKESPMRKPNTGMLEKIFRTINSGLHFTKSGLKSIEKEECLMIGDASGKPGQFSSSDKDTAERFNIDYLDVEDFVKM